MEKTKATYQMVSSVSFDFCLFSNVGIAAGLKVISLCFFVAVWYFIRRRTIREREAAAQVSRSDRQGSGVVKSSF